MYRTEKIESWGKYRDTYRIVRGVYRFSPNSHENEADKKIKNICSKKQKFSRKVLVPQTTADFKAL